MTSDKLTPQELRQKLREVEQENKELKQNKEDLLNNTKLLEHRVHYLESVLDSIPDLAERRRKAEKTIFAMNKSLRTILDSIPADIYVADMQTSEVLFMNAQMQKSFGRDCVGEICWQAFRETTGPCYHCTNPELLDDQGEPTGVITWEGYNPVNQKWYINYDRAVTWIDGRYVRIQIAMDISARIRAEDALRESEEKYRSIFENTGTATIIVEDDTTISLANREFEVLSGYRKEDIEGHKSWTDFVAHEHQLTRMLEYHYQRRVDPDSVPKRYEFRFQDRHGQKKYVSQTIDIIPGTAKSVASLLDISQLKQIQESLLEQKEKYRLLAENTADIIWSADSDLRFTYVSPSVERILGYSQKEVYAINFEDLFTSSTYAMLMNTYHAVKAGQITNTSTLELEQIRKDGSPVSVEVSLTPLFDQKRSFLGVQGITRDITERKAAEQLRVKQGKRLRQLAAKLASAQDQEQRRIAEGLHDDVAQLLTACSVKLTVARGCTSQQEAERILEDVDFLLRESNEKVRLLSFELGSSTLYRLGLLEAVQELCEGMAQRYGFHFTVKGDESSKHLDQASATALFKSVRELLFNVVKHTCAKEATVTICQDDTMLKLAVEDQGIGFPGNARHDLQDTDKGLGLFGIRERLRDFGGKMSIESEPNVCTRVTLWVPLGQG